jgi:hypothetical protein
VAGDAAHLRALDFIFFTHILLPPFRRHNARSSKTTTFAHPGARFQPGTVCPHVFACIASSWAASLTRLHNKSRFIKRADTRPRLRFFFSFLFACFLKEKKRQ